VTLLARLAVPGASVVETAGALEVESAAGRAVVAGFANGAPPLDVGLNTGSGIQNGSSCDVAPLEVAPALTVVFAERCSSDSSGTTRKLAHNVATTIRRPCLGSAVLVSVSPFSRGQARRALSPPPPAAAPA
jgi:hypothetical protein